MTSVENRRKILILLVVAVGVAVAVVAWQAGGRRGTTTTHPASPTASQFADQTTSSVDQGNSTSPLSVHPSSTTARPAASVPRATSPSTQARPMSTGTVRGSVVRPPGPDPRSGGSSGSPVPIAGDHIVARDESGATVADAVSASNGTFSFVLSPGRYTLTEEVCGTRRVVDVVAGHDTDVTITVSNTC